MEEAIVVSLLTTLEPIKCLKFPAVIVAPAGNVVEERSKLKTVVYLGILSKDKGIEDAIKTFKILSANENYQFWIVGRGETNNYEEKIRKMAKPIGKRVKFWGHVSDSKKFELLAKAHILINSSIHEGWGLVNIEANAAGTPVVAYPSAGLTDSVKDGVSGIIVKDKTAEALADGIKYLVEDDKLYAEFVNGSKKWSRNFSWEKSRKLSLDLIDRNK